MFNRPMLIVCAAVALLVLAGSASSALSVFAAESEPPQEPVVIEPGAAERVVVVMPPAKDPWWETLVVGSDRPELILRVPEGRRFVLTDLKSMCHDEYPGHHPAAEDRLWLEDRSEDGRRIILDARMRELPHEPRSDGFRGESNYDLLPQPITWEHGVHLGPGHELHLEYEFVGDQKQGYLRRFHLAGYFEDAPPRN